MNKNNGAISAPLDRLVRRKDVEMTKTTVLKQLQKHRDKIGKERDALRAMQDEINTLFESCEQGIEALDNAIQTFSEYT